MPLARFCGYVKARNYKVLVYRAPTQLLPRCWFDSSFASGPDRKSNMGEHCTLDDRCVISTTSQMIKVICKSSSEAEYYTGSKAGDSLVFMINWLTEIIGPEEVVLPGELIGDNQGSLFHMNNMLVGQRSKHIDIKAH